MRRQFHSQTPEHVISALCVDVRFEKAPLRVHQQLVELCGDFAGIGRERDANRLQQRASGRVYERITT